VSPKLCLLRRSSIATKAESGGTKRKSLDYYFLLKIEAQSYNFFKNFLFEGLQKQR